MLCKITNYSRGGSYYSGLHYSSSYSGASPDPKGKSGYASRQAPPQQPSKFCHDS